MATYKNTNDIFRRWNIGVEKKTQRNLREKKMALLFPVVKSVSAAAAPQEARASATIVAAETAAARAPCAIK